MAVHIFEYDKYYVDCHVTVYMLAINIVSMTWTVTSVYKKLINCCLYIYIYINNNKKRTLSKM
jgi:hypothetical protein